MDDYSKQKKKNWLTKKILCIINVNIVKSRDTRMIETGPFSIVSPKNCTIVYGPSTVYGMKVKKCPFIFSSWNWPVRGFHQVHYIYQSFWGPLLLILAIVPVRRSLKKNNFSSCHNILPIGWHVWTWFATTVEKISDQRSTKLMLKVTMLSFKEQNVSIYKINNQGS